jgi:hypothetical protein
MSCHMKQRLLLFDHPNLLSIHTGIKINEFDGVFPFWNLLQRVASVYPPLPELVESTAAVAEESVTLRSPLALSRAWVRSALNRRCLSSCMMAIEKQPKLGFFYYEGSLLLNSACFSKMVKFSPAIIIENLLISNTFAVLLDFNFAVY